VKVVLDTNVLVSALITPGGVCSRILRLVYDQILRVCTDERIVEEYEAVLHRPRFRLDREDILETIEAIRANGQAVTPIPLSAELPDPTDRAFLEVAVHADAVLVTGNTRHFPPKARHGVKVLTPREFLDLLREAP
jgi:putative PIN family toxin of toxin-antitoxin system